MQQGRRQHIHTQTHESIDGMASSSIQKAYICCMGMVWDSGNSVQFSIYLLGTAITYTHTLVVVGGLVMGNGSGTSPLPLIQFWRWEGRLD